MSEQTFKFKKIKRKSTGYISYCIIQIYLSSLLHNWFDVNYENGIKDDEQWNTDENSLIFGSFKKVVIASTKKTRKKKYEWKFTQVMTIIVITIQVYKAREKKKAKKKQNVIKINNVVKDIEISSILSKTSCSFFSSAFSLIQFLKIENPLLFI